MKAFLLNKKTPSKLKNWMLKSRNFKILISMLRISTNKKQFYFKFTKWNVMHRKSIHLPSKNIWELEGTKKRPEVLFIFPRGCYDIEISVESPGFSAGGGTLRPLKGYHAPTARGQRGVARNSFGGGLSAHIKAITRPRQGVR